MIKNKILLYGANGYTGTLIAQHAHEYGLRLVLAGRKEAEIKQLATALQFSYTIFSLDDEAVLLNALNNVSVVIHAAGPFIDTAKRMVEACIKTGTHYIDINGDISVFELIKSYNEKAKAANVMLLPGTGFDVVPTDCLAVQLKKKMPNATHLEIVFVPLGGQVSHGTATTMAGKAGEGGVVRVNGHLVKKPLGHTGKWIDVEGKKLFVMSIPWGDISTAYVSTGIPNITTYTGMKPSVYRILKFQFLFNWLLRTKLIRGMIQKRINKAPAGPTDEQRAKSKTYIYAKVYNAKGEEQTAAIVTADGYTVTYACCLLIAKKILMEGKTLPGYQTPASVYGEHLIFEIEGTKKINS